MAIATGKMLSLVRCQPQALFYRLPLAPRPEPPDSFTVLAKISISIGSHVPVLRTFSLGISTDGFPRKNESEEIPQGRLPEWMYPHQFSSLVLHQALWTVETACGTPLRGAVPFPVHGRDRAYVSIH